MNTRGQLQGVVTSNTRHADAGSFPHLSFAIAASLLRSICSLLCEQASIDTAAADEALRALDLPCPELRRLWDLGPLSLSQKPEGDQRQGLSRLRQLVAPSKL